MYSTCVWSALAAWGMRGVRPECMAWFSQSADESWQLQDCLLLLVCWPAPDQALTRRYIYGNSTARCLYLHTLSSRQNIPTPQSRMFVLGGSHKPPHPPVLSFLFNTTPWITLQPRTESVLLSLLCTHTPTPGNTCLHQCMVHMLHNIKLHSSQTHYIKAMVHTEKSGHSSMRWCTMDKTVDVEKINKWRLTGGLLHIYAKEWKTHTQARP